MPARPSGVLLVEDEPLILKLLTNHCHSHGATAFGASSAEEAEDVLRKHHAAIGAVVIDLCLPDADGLETRRRLGEIKPGLRCCLMSGMSMAGAELPEGFVHTMDKPFRLADVRECLAVLLGDWRAENPSPVAQRGV